jgi:predicted GNAT family N-acyltransferase
MIYMENRILADACVFPDNPSRELKPYGRSFMNTLLTISLVTSVTDLLAALELRRQIFVVEKGRAAKDDGNDLLCAHMLARQGEKVVGTCRLRPFGWGCYLEQLCIAPDARRGITVLRALTDEAIRYASIKGHQAIYGEVHPDLDQFWTRRGAAPDGFAIEGDGVTYRRYRLPLPRLREAEQLFGDLASLELCEASWLSAPPPAALQTAAA